jgi:7-carboxy-7-deazaguanine synthase
MLEKDKYYYSEIFHSIQGEGHYTGVPTAWIRFFMCNLQCNGFGQEDPTNPETYELPFMKYDLIDVKRVEDLPVWEKGCDSSYTWAKRYKHLMGHKTVPELCDEIQKAITTDSNPDGKFLHPVSGIRQHLCFTGGEPLMKHQQPAIEGILDTFKRRRNNPGGITFETNGTQPLHRELHNYLSDYGNTCEVFFSVSPKLWTVAGEKAKRAIKPDIIASYAKVNEAQGQLKFVVGDVDEQWDEMEDVVQQCRDAGCDWPVWIMPVGAREEEQSATAGEVAERAFKRGYNVAARVHVYLFGNQIGT